MTILGLQRQVREVGRIRIGQQVTASNGRRRPAKLDTLRFTSRDRTIIEAVAHLYGGTVQAWDDQWEVVSLAADVAIMLPPADMAMDQHYELWGKGFCQRRCDGQWDQVRDTACDCDPEARECSIHTRLWVMLPDLPGIGRWRLESQGYYAAVELAGVTELLAGLAGRSVLVPARLRLEQRERRLLHNGKPEVRRYAVPVIDVDASLSVLTSGMIGAGAGVPHPPPPALSPTPGPAAVATAAPAPTAPAGWQPVGSQPELPVPPVAEQMAAGTERQPRKPRKNAAEPIKPTGRQPRGAGTDKVCHLCGQPWGDTPLVRNPHDEGNRFVHRACTVERDGGGGTSTRVDPVAPGPGEPAPTVTTTDDDETEAGISPPQMRKLMALAVRAFPVDPSTPRDEHDEWLRNNVLAMATRLGQPDIESRKDLTLSTASAVIDAMQQVIDGTAGWNGNAFVNPETGEVYD